VQHIHGPISLANRRFASDFQRQNEAVVLCVVKDGENLVQPFIEHYLQLGFQHIFFLDNGSTDSTIDIIKSYSQTTILLSHEPFQDYCVIFKNFLIQKFGLGKWCVVADIDEFLYFPLRRSLSEVLLYLNKNSYDAVCIQMLDMFSKEGVELSESNRVWTLEDLKQTCCYYDLSNLEKKRYVRWFQRAVHPGLKFLYGGIRKTVFAQSCFLTKEALFFGHSNTHLKSSHLLHRSKIADFSAVFLHYKLIDNFYSATIKAVSSENHWQHSKEYKGYLATIEKEKQAQAPQPLSEPLELPSKLNLWQLSSVALLDPNQETDSLINDEFLFVSEQFRKFSHRSAFPLVEVAR